MKNALDFVKHGTTQRNFNEELTMLHFCDGCVQSYNGIVFMSCGYESEVDFVASLSSNKIINAFEACEYKDYTLEKTEHNVIIKKGKFRAQLPYTNEHEVLKKIKGEKYKVTEKDVAAMRILFPFISEDASRSWSQSFLVKKGFMYVTNNIIAARMPTSLPDCVLPIQLLSVILKVKDVPNHIVLDERVVQVVYRKDKWLRCAASIEEWPDVRSIFKKTKRKGLKPFKKGLKEAVETLAPFCEDDVLFSNNEMLSVNTCSIDIKAGTFKVSLYHLRKILSLFDECDFGAFPEAMPLSGMEGELEGLFVGMM